MPKSRATYDNTGIKLENVNATIPPDNEHTNSSIVEMAHAVEELARAVVASARALEEIARKSQKIGVGVIGCTITNGG